jgi:hypothetical protein
MSNSHATVGKQFGKLKPCNGSRMSSAFIQQVTPLNDDMSITTNRVFYRLQEGISYRTPVARIMRNAHTKENELWITSRYYSPSTQRHKGYFRDGFVAAGNSPDNIYITAVVDQGIHRHNPTQVRHSIGFINSVLKEVDKPRLREATRRGTIDSCIHHAERVMHNFTHKIPLDLIDADAYYDMQAMMGFLYNLKNEPDIDAVRAAVKGHFALLEG